MQTHTTNIREAVEHLPDAAVLVLEDISWEEYERIAADREGRPGVRLTYDQGRLEIVTTSFGHEASKEFVVRLAHVLCEEMEIPLETAGSTTQRRKRDRKATEPDTSFYIENAARMIGKEDIDLAVDPPPDVVVEIDKSNQSLSKFPIYAAFGVPEIWRYVRKSNRVEIYTLDGKEYVRSSASRSFPILTGDVLAAFIERGKTEGQTAALSAFRNWVREHH